MKQRFLHILVAVWLPVLLSACGGTSGTNVHSIQIVETEFKIASSTTTFIAGTRYHFVVSNQGKTTHEFMIMPRSEGRMNGMGMEDMDKIALTSLGNISPGETKTLDYTFPASSAQSHPEFACYLSGHYEAGMKQQVMVTA